VVLEERGVLEALLDAVSAGRKGRAYVMLACLFFYVGILFRAAEAKKNVCLCVFVYEHKE
jgi:hypothetical protein